MNKYGLRECPFCGSENTVIFTQDDNLRLPVYGVTCLNCFVVLNFTATKETPLKFQPFTSITKTKDAWNRRKDENE